MPTDWTYHADGVSTAVETKHNLDGSISSISVQLDTFKTREWEPASPDEDVDINGEEIPEHAHYDQEDDLFVEHSGGAHATLRFSMTSAGAAELASIEPEDGERFKPRHMALLHPAARIVEQIEGVEYVSDPLEALTNEFHAAEDVVIDRLDN